MPENSYTERAVNTFLDIIPKTKLEQFCRQWKITELALFGSVLRPDFRPDSDVDMLVTFAGDAHWSLLDHVRMEAEMARLIDRPVDMLTRRAVEKSYNWLLKQEILQSAQVLYSQMEFIHA